MSVVKNLSEEFAVFIGSLLKTPVVHCLRSGVSIKGELLIEKKRRKNRVLGNCKLKKWRFTFIKKCVHLAISVLKVEHGLVFFQ